MRARQAAHLALLGALIDRMAEVTVEHAGSTDYRIRLIPWEEYGAACSVEPNYALHVHGEQVLRNTLRLRSLLQLSEMRCPPGTIHQPDEEEFNRTLRYLYRDALDACLAVGDEELAAIGRKVIAEKARAGSAGVAIRRELAEALASGARVNQSDIARRHGVSRQHVSRLLKQVRGVGPSFPRGRA